MFTVGTDTEFFLEKNGKLVSAIELISAGKRSPQLLTSGGNITHDNVAMEFATPVAHDEESFVQAVGVTIKESLALLPKDISINTNASADFPEEELQSEEAKQFGCDPDYDAWALCVNEPPRDASIKPFRTVGGHLHVGYVEGSGNDFLLDPMGKVMLVKIFDLILGVPMTVLDHNEAAVNRRKLYGKAGCHRPTSYGVEYRSLSNFWTFSPVLVRLVHSLAGQSLLLFRNKGAFDMLEKVSPEEVQRIINMGDATAAEDLWVNLIAPCLPAEVVEKFNQAKTLVNINIHEEWGI